MAAMGLALALVVAVPLAAGLVSARAAWLAVCPPAPWPSPADQARAGSSSQS